MEEKKSNPGNSKLPNVVWQQPLLLREKIKENYEQRDSFMRSLPELEAAFSLCLEDPQFKKVKAEPAAAEEALTFYNHVVKDGRYIEVLKTKPEEAAEKLGIKISPAALQTIQQGLKFRGAHSRVNEFTVVTAIVATLALAAPESEIVIDHSKQVSFKL